MTDSDATQNPLVTRRRFLTAAAVVPAAAAINAVVVEPRRVTVTHHDVGSGARRPGSVLRIVQLSDLHLQAVAGHERAVAETVNALRPHVVVLTGDAIDERDNVTMLAEFLKLLDPAPAKFATLGNWEHWARVDLDRMRAACRAAGCTLLVNESVLHQHNSHDLLITGFDDWTGGTPDPIAAFANVSPHPDHLVLAHSPVYRDILAERAAAMDRGGTPEFTISLVLSGHTHGGQVALFGWAPIRPAGSGDYVAGWYRTATGPPLYVSRGLGTSLAPVRFGAPPEIAVFDWALGS